MLKSFGMSANATRRKPIGAFQDSAEVLAKALSWISTGDRPRPLISEMQLKLVEEHGIAVADSYASARRAPESAIR